MDIDALSVKFAQRLKYLREKKKLSQQQLAEAITEKYKDLGIAIGRDSIINFETVEKHHTKFKKNTGMAVKYLWCFADFFEVSVDYLLGNVDHHTTDEKKRMMCDYTGLSEESVDMLQYICNDKDENGVYLAGFTDEDKCTPKILTELLLSSVGGILFHCFVQLSEYYNLDTSTLTADFETLAAARLDFHSNPKHENFRVLSDLEYSWFLRADAETSWNSIFTFLHNSFHDYINGGVEDG